MADLIFHGQFIHATDLDGETGLTVTIDVYRTTISDGTTSQVVTDGSCTETGGGIYRYRYASADLSLYHYVANMKTASADVAQKHVACIGLVVPDALVSSRASQTSVDDVPTTAEMIAAMDADPPAVNVTMWKGEEPYALDAGEVQAKLNSFPFVVYANLVKYNSQDLYQAQVSAVDGTEITTTGITDYVGTPLADDSLMVLVGWQVVFQKQVAGIPPENVFWRATIVSYTTTTIVVDAMPDGFTSDGFTLYILPPAWGTSIDAQEVRDAMKLAPTAGDPAAGSVDKHLDDLLTTTAACASVAANSTDATASGAITRKRGNSWSIALTLGEITGYTSLWFTVKRSTDDADSAALLQVKLNSPSAADGLLYVNGAAATDATKASITVSDATTGAIVIAVDETITDDLYPGTYYYDAQMLNTGAVTTPDSGTFTITADVTRSVA